MKSTNKDYKNFLRAAYTRLPEIRARVKFIYLRRKPDIVKEYIAVAAQMAVGGKLNWFCEAGFSDVDEAVIDYAAILNYWLTYGERLPDKDCGAQTDVQEFFIGYAGHRIGSSSIPVHNLCIKLANTKIVDDIHWTTSQKT